MNLARIAVGTVLRLSTINVGLRIIMYFMIIHLENYFKIYGKVISVNESN